MRVLVVKDEVRMAGLLRRALREEGHGVDIAADGPEGLWLATENEYGHRPRRHTARPGRVPAVPAAAGVGEMGPRC